MRNITSYSKEELKEIMSDLGQPAFRAKQLHEWLHSHNVRSYDDMLNLPKSLRAQLSEKYPLKTAKIQEVDESVDGTRKYLMELADGNLVECVGILDSPNGTNHDDPRLTVCVSSQVGCPMMCAFCATGQEGFTRNLTADEIVDQVVYVGSDTGLRVDNVVVMGQGEPFNNYDAVIEALRRLNTDPGLNIGARHITVSTSGIVKGIEKFSEEPEQIRLAVSLHSAVQKTRNLIMPKLANQTLNQLHSALKSYMDRKGRRVTLEYMLLEDVNDSDAELSALIDFCADLNVHVNLLPYNQIEGDMFEPSDKKVFTHWEKTFSSNGIPVSTRKSKGSDVSGACGQLKNIKRPNI